MIRSYWIVALLWVLAVSCSPAKQPWPASRFYIADPPEQSVANAVLIKEVYERVWARAVQRLEGSRFVLQSMDPEQGRIVVNLFDEQPEQWIDCGQIHRSYTRGSETIRYESAVAQSTSYKSASTWRSQAAAGKTSASQLPRIEEVDRNTSIEARGTTRFRATQLGTYVDVVGRYRFKVSFEGTYRNEDETGEVMESGRLRPRTILHAFTTHRHNTYNEGGFPVRCRSTGRLEHELLAMAVP